MAKVKLTIVDAANELSLFTTKATSDEKARKFGETQWLIFKVTNITGTDGKKTNVWTKYAQGTNLKSLHKVLCKRVGSGEEGQIAQSMEQAQSQSDTMEPPTSTNNMRLIVSEDEIGKVWLADGIPDVEEVDVCGAIIFETKIPKKKGLEPSPVCGIIAW